MINDSSSFACWYSNVLLKVVGFNDFFVSFKCNSWFQVVDGLSVSTVIIKVLSQVLFTIDSNVSTFSNNISFSFHLGLVDIKLLLDSFYCSCFLYTRSTNVWYFHLSCWDHGLLCIQLNLWYINQQPLFFFHFSSCS